MAIKLFNRKQEMSDPYVTLDKLMSEMASDTNYIEYLRLREKVQLSIFIIIVGILVLFGFVIGLSTKVYKIEKLFDSDPNGSNDLQNFQKEKI